MYNKARALVIDEMIDAIPEVVEVSHEKQIKAAREAYKNAEANVRKHVSKLEVLKAKEDALAKAIYDATPDAVKLQYLEESYTKINGNLIITADTAKRDPNTVLVWQSSDPSVATVVDGVVTGLQAGNAIITATIEGSDCSMSLGITVLPENISEALQFVIDSHNSTAFTKRRLGIGSGTPNYYYDVMGSVSQILWKDLEINDEFLSVGNASGTYYTRADYKANVEFVTVHYTANFTAGARANANYMAGAGSDVSIHYVTGNDGVFHCLDDKLYGAWHAGDSGSRYNSNSPESVTLNGTTYQTFTWLPTGVKYDGTDLLDVVFTASDDFYYEINGKKTTIKLPKTYDAKSRTTNHIYNSDGTVSSAPGYAYPFTNKPVEEFFNNQDFAIKVVDGEYYMGPTWWSYGQVYEGRICAMGGNINSIGIESCVDKGSNLWLTWQETAKLVAKLLLDNNLGIERVKGHHFFDGKDCPQPLLENDQQIWKIFLDMVETEYERMTKFEDYEFTFKAENSTYVHKYGLIKKWGAQAQSTGYTVTVSNGVTTETITLYTWIPAK
jgi:N-acetylmuramoyl-L-alanine amidase CwlA